MSDREGVETLPPYTEASRARLVLAAELAELADFARGLVPIGEHELRDDGSATFAAEVVADAARLATIARRIVDLAAIYARLGRVTWDQIGAALDVTHQTAQQRFKSAVEQFREDMLSPEEAGYTGAIGQLRWPSPPPPETAAAELDEWVREQPRRSGDPESGPTPVSGQLARMNPHAEQRWLHDLNHQMWRDVETAGAVPPVTDRLAIAERLVQVWQQIAAGEKRTSRSTRDGLAHATRALADLRAQAATEVTEQHSSSTSSPPATGYTAPQQ